MEEDFDWKLRKIRYVFRILSHYAMTDSEKKNYYEYDSWECSLHRARISERDGNQGIRFTASLFKNTLQLGLVFVEPFESEEEKIRDQKQ